MGLRARRPSPPRRRRRRPRRGRRPMARTASDDSSSRDGRQRGDGGAAGLGGCAPGSRGRGSEVEASLRTSVPSPLVQEGGAGDATTTTAAAATRRAPRWTRGGRRAGRGRGSHRAPASGGGRPAGVRVGDQHPTDRLDRQPRAAVRRRGRPRGGPRSRRRGQGSGELEGGAHDDIGLDVAGSGPCPLIAPPPPGCGAARRGRGAGGRRRCQGRRPGSWRPRGGRSPRRRPARR